MANILFIYKDDNWFDEDQQKIATTIADGGNNVVTNALASAVDDAAVAASDLVFTAPGVEDTQIPLITNLKATTKPVICMRREMAVYLSIGGTEHAVATGSEINTTEIVNASSPFANGQSLGNLQINANPLRWDLLINPSGTTIAVMSSGYTGGNPVDSHIVFVDQGEELADTTTAAGKRLFIGGAYNTYQSDPDDYTLAFNNILINAVTEMTGTGAPADTTPDAINLGSDTDGIAPNAFHSGQFTLSGTNAPAPIVEATNIEVSLDGGLNFVSTGNIPPGATVPWRIQASPTTGAVRIATLNIGGTIAEVAVRTTFLSAPITLPNMDEGVAYSTSIIADNSPNATTRVIGAGGDSLPATITNSNGTLSGTPDQSAVDGAPYLLQVELS